MLRTVLTRFVSRKSTTNLTNILSNSKFFASLRPNDFFLESSDSVGTLVTRFARHVALKNASSMEPIKYTIRYSDYYPVTDFRTFVRDLKKVPFEQLPRMIIFTSIYQGKAQVRDLADIVNQLDYECVNNFEKMSSQQLIEMLNAFMYFLTDKLVQLDFYRLAIQKLLKDFSTDLPVTKFVEVCFYLGMWKKNQVSTQLMNNLMEHFLEHYVDELEIIDFAIVANAAYKTSTRINNKEFNDRLISEVLSMDEPDVSLLITFLKSHRLNRIKSPETIEKVTKWIKNGSLDNTDIRGLGHILAYFSENRVANVPLLSELTFKCLSKIDGTVRLKDISNLLWSCANLRIQIERKEIKDITNIIFDLLQEQRNARGSDTLIDICLSLWMLGNQNEELIEIALSGMKNYHKNQQRVRLDSRQILLRTLLDWETGNQKSKEFRILGKGDDFLVNNRIGLQLAYKTLDTLRNEFGIKSINFIQQIRELNIVGISVMTKAGDGFFVEVLDETNTLSDNKTAFGLMKLKLDTLKSKNFDFALVNVAGVASQEKMEQIIKEGITNFLGTSNEMQKTEQTEPVSVVS